LEVEGENPGDQKEGGIGDGNEKRKHAGVSAIWRGRGNKDRNKWNHEGR